MAPSMVVLLNTPLILLPMRLIPKDSPLFDVLLHGGRVGVGPVWQSVIRENRQTVQMHTVAALKKKKKKEHKRGACSLRGETKEEGSQTGTREESGKGGGAQQLANQGRTDGRTDAGKRSKAAKLSLRSRLTSRVCLKSRQQTRHTGGGASHFEGQSPHEIMSSAQRFHRVT